MTIPFELDHGHIFVSAFVNGFGPYRFGFDTGASGEGRVDAQLSAQLALPAVGQAETSDGVKSATAQLVALKNLKVGPIKKDELQVLSRDYNGGRGGEHSIMGIVGRDFTRGWLVQINYPNRTITFSKGHLRKGPQVLTYGPSYSVPVCFASAGCFPGKVDTGSSRSIVVPKELASKLTSAPPVPIGQAMRTNGVTTLYQLPLNGPVRVAGIVASNPTILYADPSGDSISIGSDFLKDYILTIDQDRKLLRIAKR